MKNINFVVGYIENECSVRCYTMLLKSVKRFNIKHVEQLTKELFDIIDSKASKEYFNFLEVNKSKLAL